MLAEPTTSGSSPTPPREGSAEAEQPLASRLRSLVVPGVLTLVSFAVLVALGNWQLQRLAWKQDLIARVSERPSMPAADLPPASAWSDFDVAANEYRPFRMRGRFLHAAEAFVFTNVSDTRRRFSGPGYWVVTPFQLEGGGTVFINRGFAPQDRVRPADRGDALDPGPQNIAGLLRPDENRNLFTPVDRPGDNLFFARSIAALAAAKRVPPPVAPFTIDLVAAETPPGGLPQAGGTLMTFSNNHLGYAFTWFGLAAALLAVFTSFAWTRLRPSRPGSQSRA